MARNPRITHKTLAACLLSFMLLVSVLSTGASALTLPATPANYIVDTANVIDQGREAQLNAYLRELEQTCGVQLIVLTVDTTEGADIDSFSLHVAEGWKLGKKGRDDGMLITIAMQEKKYRFEVGYGLEALLPDSLVGSIGRDNIVPYFKRGDYSGGISATVLAVTDIIAKDRGVTLTGRPPDAAPINQREDSLPGTIFMLLLAALFLYLFIRNPRLMLLILASQSMSSGWRGGGGFGSGGGFGGGGFGGGGGGGFGGGGASGGW